jgi:hypothetical protein
MIKRNSPCHCESGKKYKHCCYLASYKTSKVLRVLEMKSSIKNKVKNLGFMAIGMPIYLLVLAVIADGIHGLTYLLFGDGGYSPILLFSFWSILFYGLVITFQHCDICIDSKGVTSKKIKSKGFDGFIPWSSIIHARHKGVAMTGQQYLALKVKYYENNLKHPQDGNIYLHVCHVDQKMSEIIEFIGQYKRTV